MRGASSFSVSALVSFSVFPSVSGANARETKSALPVMISIMIIVSAGLLLKRFTRFTNLMISAISLILIGFECVLLEFLISRNFTEQEHFIWSYYPLITFVVLGIILIIIDKNHKLNEKVKKSFFI